MELMKKQKYLPSKNILYIVILSKKNHKEDYFSTSEPNISFTSSSNIFERGF